MKGNSINSILQGIVIFLIFVCITCFGIGYLRRNLNPDYNKPKNDTPTTIVEDTLVEDASILDYTCVVDSCSYTIKDASGNSAQYNYNEAESILNAINNYSDYVKLDINYSVNGEEKTITSYRISLKTTGEDVSSLKTEDELREKLGLYTVGTHTESLTFKSKGSSVNAISEGETITYYEYTFVNDNNVEFKMLNKADNLELVLDQKYNVSFEVKSDLSGYSYIISAIN